MTLPDGRFSRQLRLAEVGEPGQARLCAAEPVVGTSNAAAIERSYLLRAGVRRVSDTRTPAATPPFMHGEHFRHETCRDVAEGAWLALGQIRAILSP